MRKAENHCKITHLSEIDFYGLTALIIGLNDENCEIFTKIRHLTYFLTDKFCYF